jgi:hypothetical protein
MNLLRHLIRPYLFARHRYHDLTRTGSFGKDGAQRVQKQINPEWNALKQALWRYHIKQFHDSSCSVASVVSCLNAIRSLKNNVEQPIRQKEILDKVKTGHWKQRMSANGYRGRRGLPLPLLGRVVEESLAAYDVNVKFVDVVQVPKNAPSSILSTLKHRLGDFDHHGNGLIIAHFDQGTLMPTLNIPHISPVGAYDARSGSVTMLDVDMDMTTPYQVSFKRFCKGLSCNYHHMFKPFGYGSGGYVYIEI